MILFFRFCTQSMPLVLLALLLLLCGCQPAGDPVPLDMAMEL